MAKSKTMELAAECADNILVFGLFCLFCSLRRDLDILFVDDLKSPNTRKESIDNRHCAVWYSSLHNSVKLIP